MNLIKSHQIRNVYSVIDVHHSSIYCLLKSLQNQYRCFGNDLPDMITKNQHIKVRPNLKYANFRK